MKTWILSGWVHLVVGFAIGWVVFKRPAVADGLIGKVKDKIKALWSKISGKVA